MTPLVPKYATMHSVISAWARCADVNIKSPQNRGNRASLLSYDYTLGAHARRLSDRVFRGAISADDIVDLHSHVPMYASFMTALQALGWRDRLVGEAPGRDTIAMSIRRSSTVEASNLRKCPTCVTEDRAHYGCAHWRLFHQWPVARHCVVHGDDLVACCVVCKTPYVQGHEPALADDPCRTCGSEITFAADRYSAPAGYLVWPNALRGAPIDARLAIDERSEAAADVARLVLSYLTEQVASTGVAKIRLRFPARQAVVREVAAEVGFAKSSDGGEELQKLTMNGIVTSSNWIDYREALLSASNVRLPHEVPEFRSVDQQIAIHGADGNRVHMSLLALESRLAPALFCLPGRAATLTPLRRTYAEHLLGHVPQGSLLPQARARLFSQRHFINGAQARSAFTRGGLIAFYESGKGQGLAAVVALARVVHSYQREEAALKREDFAPSVLDSDQLLSIGTSAVRTVTAFDNLQLLPRPVPLSVLRELGCGSATQLLTSRRLTDKQLQGILLKGLE
jgi:hypothetical protein